MITNYTPHAKKLHSISAPRFAAMWVSCFAMTTEALEDCAKWHNTYKEFSSPLDIAIVKGELVRRYLLESVD